jgi:hypothetical protein
MKTPRTVSSKSAGPRTYGHGPSRPHPHGQGPHAIHVPRTHWPDGSKGAGSPEPVGAHQGTPKLDRPGYGGTMDHSGAKVPQQILSVPPESTYSKTQVSPEPSPGSPSLAAPLVAPMFARALAKERAKQIINQGVPGGKPAKPGGF